MVGAIAKGWPEALDGADDGDGDGGRGLRARRIADGVGELLRAAGGSSGRVIAEGAVGVLHDLAERRLGEGDEGERIAVHVGVIEGLADGAEDLAGLDLPLVGDGDGRVVHRRHRDGHGAGGGGYFSVARDVGEIAEGRAVAIERREVKDLALRAGDDGGNGEDLRAGREAVGGLVQPPGGRQARDDKAERVIIRIGAGEGHGERGVLGRGGGDSGHDGRSIERVGDAKGAEGVVRRGDVKRFARETERAGIGDGLAQRARFEIEDVSLRAGANDRVVGHDGLVAERGFAGCRVGAEKAAGGCVIGLHRPQRSDKDARVRDRRRAVELPAHFPRDRLRAEIHGDEFLIARGDGDRVIDDKGAVVRAGDGAVQGAG